jgi:plastocyanin
MKNLLLASFLLFAALPAFGQTTHEVIVGNNGNDQFSPSQLAIRVGDSVRWVWDSGRHNVHQNNDAFYSGNPTRAPFTFEVEFDAAFIAANPPVSPGSDYAYRCDPHSNMTGNIIIDPAPQPTLSVSNLVGGQNAQLEMTAGASGGKGWFIYSLAGPGEVMTNYGFSVGLSPSLEILGARPVTAVGVATLSAFVPARATGVTVSIQAIEQTTTNRFAATNVVTAVIQ